MKTLRSFLATLALLTAAFSLTPAARAAEIIPELRNKGFNTLLTAIVAAELDGILNGAGPFTLLGPTDVAFRDIPKAQLDALLADKTKLQSVLKAHVIEGKLSSADLKSGTVKTLAGSSLEAKVVDGKIKIGSATLVKPDMAATNGIIHGIDKLLIP